MNQLINLYVFRHGETQWNALKKFQGHTDIPLNDTGKSQAQTLVAKFKSLQPEICISSDLIRAVETAKIGLSDFDISYVYSALLRESHLGDVEGLEQQTIIDRYGQDILTRWRSIKKEDLSMSFPNGETKLQHTQRVRKYIQEFIKNNSHYQKIAVSTHGGSVVRLVHSCMNAPVESITIPNCCLYHVQYDMQTDDFVFVGQL